VYASSRGQVEVSPVLKLMGRHNKHLAKFKLTLKHALTTVMELCIKLSSTSAVLPVLTTLMLHANNQTCKDHFTVGFIKNVQNEYILIIL